MKFPTGNKIHKSAKEEFGENAKLLEEHLVALNWRVWLRAWAIGLGIFCATIFAILITIELALKIL